MVLGEIDLSSEETENGDEVQTSVLQIPDFNQFKDLRALKLKVPCVTWGDGGRLLFKCDAESFNTRMCDREVIRFVKPIRGERYSNVEKCNLLSETTFLPYFMTVLSFTKVCIFLPLVFIMVFITIVCFYGFCNYKTVLVKKYTPCQGMI